MRLLYFTRDYTTHDHRFLSALAKTEHQVAYLRLEKRGHALEDRALPPEIEILHWAGGKEPASLRNGRRLLFDLKRLLRQVKPDLVLAGPIQRAALLVALAGFKPLVSMSWGYDLLVDAQRNAWWSWATRYTLKRSAAFVGDCQTIRELAKSYGMLDKRIVTFPWGVELQQFTPGSRPDLSAADTSLHPFTLLSTRGWEPIYGVEIIARAFVTAAQERPELRLVMLGNGSQAGLLRQIFQRGGVEARVFFPGQVSQNDLPRYYQGADLYISASHSDGTSISLLEALACGTPAIVSDIPGNREWITPGENGWWFRDGDADALTKAILSAVEQRQALPQMGQAARRLAEGRADWEKNFPQLFQAFEIALGAHSAK
ncbi:MAG: glycosyltransferase [Anaerolineales bacterium]|nr:glycosyltransferase [Anaerolineales bacterium]